MAGWIGEVKSTSAGKAEDRPHDGSSGLSDPPFHGFEIDGVNDNQRPTSDPGCGLKTSAQPAVGKAGIVRPIVLEAPAECLALESLDIRYAGDRELDVIDPAIVLGGTHRNLLQSRTACSAE